MATSATALHYGISVFEGLSIVENNKTGKLQGFRCKEHLQAFSDSSAHLDMPEFDNTELLNCIKKLAVLDKEWINVFDSPD